MADPPTAGFGAGGRTGGLKANPIQQRIFALAISLFGESHWLKPSGAKETRTPDPLHAMEVLLMARQQSQPTVLSFKRRHLATKLAMDETSPHFRLDLRLVAVVAVDRVLRQPLLTCGS